MILDKHILYRQLTQVDGITEVLAMDIINSVDDFTIGHIIEKLIMDFGKQITARHINQLMEGIKYHG